MKKLLAALAITLLATGCATNKSPHEQPWEDFKGTAGSTYFAQNRFSEFFGRERYDFRAVNDSEQYSACYKIGLVNKLNMRNRLLTSWVLVGPGETGYLGYIEQANVYADTYMDVDVRIRQPSDGKSGLRCNYPQGVS